MNIRFLILWLALGLLAAGGCSKVKEMYEDKRYEIKVRTNFERVHRLLFVSYICPFGDD